MKKFLFYAIFFSVFPNYTFTQNYWQPVEGLYGGLMRGVKCAPDGTIYLATESSGVYKSTDDGKTWFGAYNGIDYMDVADIAVSSKGEVFVTNYINPTLKYSNDEGKSWIDLIPEIGMKGNALIFAVGDEVFLTVYPNNYILKADRSGWVELSEIDAVSNILTHMCTDGEFFYAKFSNKIFKSSDHGYTWQQISNENNFKCLATDSKGKIYKMVSGYTYISSDHGSSWEYLVDISPIFFCSDKDNYLFGVVSKKGIYRSTDDGKNWQLIYPTSDLIYGLDINKNGVIIAIADYGPIISTDRGITWQISDKGLKANEEDLLFSLDDGTIFAGNEIGLYRTKDFGESWEKLISSEDKFYPPNTMNIDSKGNLYAILNRKLYYSNDTGNNWKSFNIIGQSFEPKDITFLNDTVYISGLRGGIYKSYNLTDWILANHGIPGIQDGSHYSYNVGKLLTTKDGVILACPAGEGIYRSSDGGSNWVKSSSGLTANIIHNLAVRNSKTDITKIQGSGGYVLGDIFAATSYCCGIIGKGIYRSTDNGQTWEVKCIGIETFKFRSIVITEKGELYTGSSSSDGQGVYRSRDNGESWELLPSSGLPKLSIVKLMYGKDNRLYAALSGGCLYRTEFSVNGAGDETEARATRIFDAYIEYLMPGNYSLNINLKESADMQVTIYDLQGNFISELSKGNFEPGSLSIEIPSANLTSGTYFITIDSRKLKQTIKFNVTE